MILRDWLAAATRRMEAIGIESPRLEAEMLATHVLLVDRTWVVAHPEAEIPDGDAEQIIQRRLKREPLAYILGRREFYGRDFLVGSGVLIPRQETETLVEAALEIEKGELKVLDIGTGSGCIATTLSLERPDWQVYGSDISTKALDVARKNGELLKANVEWLHANGASGIQETGFDLVVSNPPYVGRGEPLPPEIRDFEPDAALYAGPAGLDFYRRLCDETPRILKPQGLILLELGAGQLDPVRAIFQRAEWNVITWWKDLLGIERVVGFRNS